MLVCSVVLRPKRGTLASTIVETATATDAPSINAVFAIIADDPGAASDTVSAFVGQLMVEAASAAAVVDAGSLRNAAIVEETNAAATFVPYVPGPIAAAIAETATAASTQDAGGAAVVIYGAVLDGTFVDPLPPATLLGTDVLDGGPVTVFEP